jgi:hypothetical protein
VPHRGSGYVLPPPLRSLSSATPAAKAEAEETGKVVRGDKMKFRKKPVVIDATRWFKFGDHPDVAQYMNGSGWIETLEGGHVVTPGDWVITGVKGEHYPCKPDIFEATYEPAE